MTDRAERAERRRASMTIERVERTPRGAPSGPQGVEGMNLAARLSREAWAWSRLNQADHSDTAPLREAEQRRRIFAFIPRSR